MRLSALSFPTKTLRAMVSFQAASLRTDSRMRVRCFSAAAMYANFASPFARGSANSSLVRRSLDPWMHNLTYDLIIGDLGQCARWAYQSRRRRVQPTFATLNLEHDSSLHLLCALQIALHVLPPAHERPRQSSCLTYTREQARTASTAGGSISVNRLGAARTKRAASTTRSSASKNLTLV